MLKFKLDVEATNAAIKNGSFPIMLEKLMKLTRPEATYFGVEDGCRTGFIVFDMQDSSMMPQIGEMLFMDTNAKIFVGPIMNFEDLQNGLKAAFK